MRRLCYLHKVLSAKLFTYLYELIPPIINSHRNPGCYRALYWSTDLFRNSFLPFSINERNKLDPDIRNLDSHTTFRKKLLSFVRPSEKSIYKIYDTQGSKLLNRLRLSFNHLCKHNFRHNFTADHLTDTVNPLWTRWLLRLKAQSILFYATKIIYHFAEPLWMNEVVLIVK